ncbi:hypothetical protein [Bradyrhizobium viridifuturi]|uniref:hypothetical protein n=1 Tax=Bradyrhizobium viridifuturi TaxID=1654716 RepID=UPI0012FF31BE|nr:hypothetical protein [Bradyrhizobium viridifuturi]
MKHFSSSVEFQATCFDPSPCGEISDAAQKLGNAQIKPLIAVITPAPAATGLNRDNFQSDQIATI